MSNPLAAKSTAPVQTARVIKTVKFAGFGRTGSAASAVREVHMREPGRPNVQGTFETIEEDEHGGVLIDNRIRVPHSNVLWIEYAE